ncbi:MAG: hypothetical protein AAF399_00270 [Bacteroidota bacterium]
MKRGIIFAAGWWLLFGTSLFAQNITLSPYSRYAIGDIFSSTTTRNAGMGGIGVATDNYFSINRVNPASYADIRYTTMDLSAFGQFNQMSSETASISPFNAGFHDAAFAFPSNNGGPSFVFGFAPYSSVGYEVRNQREFNIEEELYTEETNYRGQGGLNQAFLGVGGKLLKGKLRVGGNFQYIWGNTQYNWLTQILQDTLPASQFETIQVQENVFIGGVNGQLGLMFVDTINSTNGILLRVGGTAETTVGMGGDRLRAFTNGLISDTVGTFEEGPFSMPLKIGGGLMLHRPGRWSFGADVVYQDWTDFEYFSSQPELGPEIRIGLGGEIIPNFAGEKYHQRFAYRFGAFYKQTYIQFNGTPVNDLGLTFGIGLPAGSKGNNRFNPGRATSRINISAELGRRGAVTENLPLEQLYARLRLGISINDRWFVRRVVD